MKKAELRLWLGMEMSGDFNFSRLIVDLSVNKALVCSSTLDIALCDDEVCRNET